MYWKQVSLGIFYGSFSQVISTCFARALEQLCIQHTAHTEGIWNLGHGCVSERCGLSNISSKIYEFQGLELKVKDESHLSKQEFSLRQIWSNDGPLKFLNMWVFIYIGFYM